MSKRTTSIKVWSSPNNATNKDWHSTDGSTSSMSTQEDLSLTSNSTHLSWWGLPIRIGDILICSPQFPHIDFRLKKCSSIWRSSWWPVWKGNKETVCIPLSCWALYSGNYTRGNSTKGKLLWSQPQSSALCWVTSSSTKSTHKILPKPLLIAFRKENWKIVEIRSGSTCGDRFFWIGTCDAFIS